MDKKTQDLAWKCLPKEAREETRAEYQNAIEGSDLEDFLIDFFGHHNLTSDTEPSELLYVERKKVQEMYKQGIQKTTELHIPKDYCATCRVLDQLFGDKCLPDKEETPKFDKGDLVKIKGSNAIIPLVIDGVFPNKLKGGFNYIIKGAIGMYREEDLELSHKQEQPSVQVEPKNFFESDYGIGDKVVVCISSIGKPRKEVVTLIRQYQPQCEYNGYAKTWVIQTQDGQTFQSNEVYFEPYTEPETKDMEEK